MFELVMLIDKATCLAVLWSN